MNYTTWKRILQRRGVGTDHIQSLDHLREASPESAKENVRAIIKDLDRRVALLEMEVQNIKRV
jgi:hypothetical protein